MQHVRLHVFTYDLLCFLFVLLFVLRVCDIYLVCYCVLLFLFALSVVIQTCFVFCSLVVAIVCCIIAVLFVLILCFVVSLLCFFLVILVRVFFWGVPFSSAGTSGIDFQSPSDAASQPGHSFWNSPKPQASHWSEAPELCDVPAGQASQI